MDRPESPQTESLLDAQRNFEKRFSCPICLEPRLKMVVSSCQHRICTDCLYDKQNKLIEPMSKCPTCQRQNVYPAERPDIPEDSIEIQRQLGVTQCPLDGCDAGLWIWDVEKHIESCSYAVFSPKRGSKRKQLQKTKNPENVSDSPKSKHQKQEPSSQSKTPKTYVRKTQLNTTNNEENRIALRPRDQVKSTPQYYPNSAARQWAPSRQIYNRENFNSIETNYMLRSLQMQGQPFGIPMYRQ